MSEGYKSIFNLNVLVVDDSRTFLKAFEKFFQEEPYHIDYAENALVALDKLSKTTEERHYDLVILDITMPGMDGFEAVREIRQRQIKTKVLAHTATFEEHGREKFLNSGFDDVIPKPSPMPDLKQIILGLCQQILEEHNAEIRAEVRKKESDGPSRPVLKKKSPADLQSSNPPKTLADIRILAVDDSKVIRNAILWGLSKAPYQVECVENGVLALEKLDEPGVCPFDLILLDINMPFMGGNEAVGAIRSLYPGVCIVAHTSEHPGNPKEHYLSLGFDDVIAKPLPLPEFRKAVDRLCEDLLKRQGIPSKQPLPPSSPSIAPIAPKPSSPPEESAHPGAYNKLFQRVLLLEIEKKELSEKVKHLEKRLSQHEKPAQSAS